MSHQRLIFLIKLSTISLSINFEIISVSYGLDSGYFVFSKEDFLFQEINNFRYFQFFFKLTID